MSLEERTVTQEQFGFGAAKLAKVLFLGIELGHYAESDLVRVIELGRIKDESDKIRIFLDEGCARRRGKIAILSAGDCQGSRDASGIEDGVDGNTLLKFSTHSR